jgi:multidrug efflux pump subunit AcrB
MSIRNTGGVSTLAVIDGIRGVLPEIEKIIPKDVSMILLFLGNWRLTLIILAAIPLSILTAVLVMYGGGQTLNTMTLGGFALAVGILVDNGTVVIENIERHVGLDEPVEIAIINGTREVGIPTFLSTLCICIVFVPVFMLQGTRRDTQYSRAQWRQ